MKSRKAYIDAVSMMIIIVSTFASLDLVPPTGAAEQNGPRMDRLYFKMYIDTTAEWEGLKANEFDVMDWTLSQPQYQEWVTSPALQAAIAVEEEKDLGMFEFDLNCNATVEGLDGGIYRQPTNPAPNPTGDPAFRAAIAKLVDKYAIATSDFQGLLEILDVPAIPPVHNDFINPSVIGVNYAFQYDGAQAQLDLDTADYDQVTGVDNPYVGGPDGYLENVYPWAVPYMRRNALSGNLIQDDFDWGGGVQGLTIYSRADKPDRAAVGRRMRDVLRASGIPVVYREVDRTTCNRQVMRYFSYHFYTGSWRLNEDVDHLHDFYTSEFANPRDYNYMLFNGQGPAMLYTFAISAAYETAIDVVKYAPSRADMITAAKDIQAKLWGPTTGWFASVGGMPSIILGRYYPIRTAYKKGWEGIVNVEGVGVGNWYSTFLGNIPSNPTVTTIRMGLSARVEGLHPVTSECLWDYIVLDEVFDPLCCPDEPPYTGLAEDRLVGTWNDAGVTKTTVEFTLRSGLKWHPNGEITFPEDAGGDGATEPANSAGADLTVDDVAFSWLYHMAQWGWSYSGVYQIKEVQTKNGPATWPMDALVKVPGGSGLTATWTANVDLKANEVRALMDITSFLSLHWIGGVYILPMFIWKHVWDAYAFDPLAYNAVIGSGPYKLAPDGYVPDVSVTLDANRNYYLTTGSGPTNALIDELAHRQGDAGSSAGSGPGAYDRWVNVWDLAYFVALYSTESEPYTDYPMPNYWRDDVYTSLIRSPPVPPGPFLPVDGTGQESTDGINWGPVIAYPWRVKNPGAGPAYLYVDFNYDHYLNLFDFMILGQHWGQRVPTMGANAATSPRRPPRPRR